MNTNTHTTIKKILDYVYPGLYKINEFFDSEIGLNIISITITPTPHKDYILSLQTLFQQMINDESVCVDINGSVVSEIEKIKEDVYMCTQKVSYYKKPISLPPQNAFVRKIVHGYISNKTEFKSESVGIGRERHIVISIK